MIERNYKVQDVADYLLEYYGFKWISFLVKDYDSYREIKKSDFSGPNKTLLLVTTLIFDGAQSMNVWINVSNKELRVWKGHPIKPLIPWPDYLAQRHNQEQNINKI